MNGTVIVMFRGTEQYLILKGLVDRAKVAVTDAAVTATVMRGAVPVEHATDVNLAWSTVYSQYEALVTADFNPNLGEDYIGVFTVKRGGVKKATFTRAVEVQDA